MDNIVRTISFGRKIRRSKSTATDEAVLKEGRALKRRENLGSFVPRYVVLHPTAITMRRENSGDMVKRYQLERGCDVSCSLTKVTIILASGEIIVTSWDTADVAAEWRWAIAEVIRHMSASKAGRLVHPLSSSAAYRYTPPAQLPSEPPPMASRVAMPEPKPSNVVHNSMHQATAGTSGGNDMGASADIATTAEV